VSDLLTIGSSGVTAYQRALATVSNNIANVSTDGYTRQDVSLVANQPAQVGGGYIGTGARFDAVKRQYDAFVNANLRNSNSDLQSQKPLLSYVNRLIDVMGGDSIGLTTAMNRFFQSARELSTDPASVVSRSLFLRDSDGLAARFRELASQFQLLDTETRQAVDTNVGQVNSLTTQLAQLNRQLAKESSESSQPSELLDQRDRLLGQLSDLVAVKTKFATNGAVLVSVGDTIDQGVLINGINSRAISVQPSSSDPTKLDFVLDPYGKPETIPYFTSGKLGGTISFRDQVLTPASDALDNLSSVVVKQINSIHSNGLDAEGKLGGDLFGFAAGLEGKASGMQLVIQDTNRVAAAGQFRVIDDPLNSGSAQARISFADPSYAGPTGLTGGLALGLQPQLGEESLRIDGALQYASAGVVKAGTQDLHLTLQAPTATQQIQVLTRDGRHLAGGALSTQLQSRLMQASNGMEAGATYDASMLNAKGSEAYMDMDIFMGAKADVQQIQSFNSATGQLQPPVPTAAVLTGAALSGGVTSAAIAAGAININGVSLGALAAGASVSDVATWINNSQTGLSATNKVTASVTDAGQLQIQRASANVTDDIRLGLGAVGKPSDLKALGFDTGLFIKGASKDDLLVFVTDTSSTNTAVNVTSTFTGVGGTMKQLLRESPLQVQIVAGSGGGVDYKIIDTATATELARRSLDLNVPNPVISYRGLRVELSTQPKAGDKFTLDGNRDGIGNNESMLRMVDLENDKVMPGGLTMTESYIERVNQVGNVAQQVTIAQQALQVVHEQAKQTRDSVSGVSLDQEASALVRYQQAYQANARVMQTSIQLFDAILQVR
jgi:flagellar hook-associated protein FlgK